MPVELLNAFRQPVGAPVPGWSMRAKPQRAVLAGRHGLLAPLDPERHAAQLYSAYSQASDGRDWTYMSSGPFTDVADYKAYAERAAASADPLHFAVVDANSGQAVGTLALMRIEPTHGVIEVGHVAFSPLLQRTRLSTEAQYLLMRHVFDDLGYRRYEWKCDSLNEPSRRAAGRLGFEFEGVFRQAIVYKGRNRDTAWFSAIDSDWPALKAAFERWLDDDNFDARGKQRQSLAALRSAVAGKSRAT